MGDFILILFALSFSFLASVYTTEIFNPCNIDKTAIIPIRTFVIFLGTITLCELIDSIGIPATAILFISYICAVITQYKESNR